MGFTARLGAAWRQFKSADGTLELFREVYGNRLSKSGQPINVVTALQVAVVFACLRVIAEGIAQAPLKVFRERADGNGSDPAVDSPLYNLLYRRPNAWQTSFAFRETMLFHLALVGNFYALKVRVRGQLGELIPIEPGRVLVRQNSDLSLSYTVSSPFGASAEIAAEDIWHVRGPSWNSWFGMEAIKYAREAIGLAIASEASQAQMQKDGLKLSGTYSMEGVLKKPDYDSLRDFIVKTQAGGEGVGGLLILDRSAKFSPNQLNAVEAQLLQTRGFQVEEICREFRVMPIMVGFSDKTATYASAEQMFLAHVVHCLSPWAERIEQAIDNDLIDDPELYAKFNLNALMRGAFNDRMTGYSKALGAGGSPAWMTPNEVRALEEMNPINGGDDLPKPTNPPVADPAPAPKP